MRWRESVEVDDRGGGWCYYKRLGSAPNKLPHINEILLQPHHHAHANISISKLTLQLAASTIFIKQTDNGL